MPAEASELKQELCFTSNLHDSDQRSVCDMQPNGEFFIECNSMVGKKDGSYQMLIAIAEQRSKAVMNDSKNNGIW